MILIPNVDEKPEPILFPNVEEDAPHGGGVATGAPEDPPLRVQLMAHWKFDESGNWTIPRADSVGSETLTNGITTAIASVAGLLNNGVNFNAFSAGPALQHADDAVLGMGPGVSFAWSTWFKQNNAGGGSTVPAPGGVFLGKWTNPAGGGGATNQDYALSVSDDGNNRLHWAVRDLVGVPHEIVVPTVIAIGAWHHVACGYDDSTKEIWIQLDAGTRLTLACVGVQRTSRFFTVLSNGALGPADITMDEVGLWHRSLTVGNVSTLQNGGSPLPLATYFP